MSGARLRTWNVNHYVIINVLVGSRRRRGGWRRLPGKFALLRAGARGLLDRTGASVSTLANCPLSEKTPRRFNRGPKVKGGHELTCAGVPTKPWHRASPPERGVHSNWRAYRIQLARVREGPFTCKRADSAPRNMSTITRCLRRFAIGSGSVDCV